MLSTNNFSYTHQDFFLKNKFKAMKQTQRFFLFISIILGCTITAFSQNLDSIPTEKRDSLLKAISKEIILKYGPGYYREYKVPTIERVVVPPSETNPEGINVGRAFYMITYWYDKTKEHLEEDFAAKVKIWADTGEPGSVLFGCNYGYILDRKKTRSSKEQPPIPYVQSNWY